MSSQTADAGDSSESSADGGGGWFGSWIQAAKEKSAEALSLVKRDLVEFTTTMHDDSAKVAASVKEKLTQENATAATQKVKLGVTSLLGGISKALIDPTDEYRPTRVGGGEAVFDRAKARLHAIQIDPTTYTVEPSDERYAAWLDSFNMEEKKGNIAELLVSNVEVRALHTQLVPFSVSNVDFWRRYYYKLLLLSEDEERRLSLKKRAETVKDEHELGWDEDDDDAEDGENWTEAQSESADRPAEQDSDLALQRLSATDPNTSAATATRDHNITTTATTIDIKLSANDDHSRTVSSTSASSSNETPPFTLSSNSNPVQQHDKQILIPETVRQRDSTSDIVQDQNPEKPVEVSKSNTVEFRSISPPVSSAGGSEECSVASPDESIIAPSGEDSRHESPELLTVASAEVMTKTGGVRSSESGQSSVPSMGGWSALSDVKNSGSEDDILRTTDRDNLVVVGAALSDRTTPSDGNKESVDDDWEKDFDADVTEAELQSAQEALKNRLPTASTTDTTKTGDEKSEDWEDW